MSGSSTASSSPPMPRRPSNDGSGRRWMQDGRTDTGAQWAFIDSLERPADRQSRDANFSMTHGSTSARHGEFPVISAQTSTFQGTVPSGGHPPIDLVRPMSKHTAGDRKRRLTSTGEYARLQRTRSGDGPRRNDTLSGGPLPHRSASMIVNPSRATSSAAAGSSYHMALDIASSPPNSVSRLSYQDSMESPGGLTGFSRFSAASRSGPSFPASTRTEMGFERYRNAEVPSPLSPSYSWNGSGSLGSGDVYRGNSSEIPHRGSRPVTVHRYGNGPDGGSTGRNEGQPGRRDEDGRFWQGLDEYGAGSSLTECGLRRASDRQEWQHGEGGDLDGMTLPRWQPDAEVSECPICGTVFSFWHRKHHCRKCGRVVCSACSPHRITIPRQFIVRPPASTALPSSAAHPPRPIIDLTGDDSLTSTSTINPALGGGEEVRLCNPCVPDPNPNPPGYASLRPHGHRSTHSFSSAMGNTLSSESVSYSRCPYIQIYRLIHPSSAETARAARNGGRLDPTTVHRSFAKSVSRFARTCVTRFPTSPLKRLRSVALAGLLPRLELSQPG